jgi:hypothetical protein
MLRFTSLVKRLTNTMYMKMQHSAAVMKPLVLTVLHRFILYELDRVCAVTYGTTGELMVKMDS